MTESVNQECQTILGGISAYLDGDLDTTACEAIERHCQGCLRCAALVKELRETVGLCRRAASVPLPESVQQRARASVQRLLDADSGVSLEGLLERLFNSDAKGQRRSFFVGVLLSGAPASRDHLPRDAR